MTVFKVIKAEGIVEGERAKIENKENRKNIKEEISV